MMMTHCDRCNSIVKAKKPMSVFEKFAANIAGSYNYGVVEMNDGDVIRKMDLCDNCRDELERWMKNGQRD